MAGVMRAGNIESPHVLRAPDVVGDKQHGVCLQFRCKPLAATRCRLEHFRHLKAIAVWGPGEGLGGKRGGTRFGLGPGLTETHRVTSKRTKAPPSFLAVKPFLPTAPTTGEAFVAGAALEKKRLRRSLLSIKAGGASKLVHARHH
jgi:hypothetical protein